MNTHFSFTAPLRVTAYLNETREGAALAVTTASRALKRLGLLVAAVVLLPAIPSQAQLTATNSTTGLFDGSSGTRTVTFTGAEAGFGNGIITDLNIAINFAKADGSEFDAPYPGGTPFHNEIVFRLTSPGGTTVNLINSGTFNPGSVLFDGTILFDDAAAQPVNVNPDLPQAGTFRPVSLLSAFNAETLLGIWTLFIEDTGGDDALRFREFSLIVLTTAAPLEPTSDPTFLVIDTGAIFSTLQSGLPLALAQREILANVARTATRDVGGRLFRLRSGFLLDDGAAGPVGDGKTSKESKDVIEEPFRHFELFATGDYGNYDQDDAGSAHGFGTDVWVGTAGFEWHLNRNFTWGLAASAITSDTEISQHIGGETIDGMAFSTYFSAAWSAFYVDALYSYGVFDHDVTRHTLVGGDAHGDFESRTHTVQLNTGYNFKIGRMTTGPLASLEWLNGDLDGYNERGGSTAALEYNGQNFDSLISRLGWQVSRTWSGNSCSLTGQVRASWDHEYLDSAESVATSLLTSPFATITGTNVTRGAEFSASGETSNPGRDYMNLGMGLSATFGDRVTAGAEYETHLFQDGASAHLVSIKASWAF